MIPPPPLAITVELEGVLDLIADDRDAREVAFTALRRGAFLGAEFIRAVWSRVAGALDIRGGFGDDGHVTYQQGIQSAGIVLEQERTSGGDYAIELSITNSSPHAQLVEEGHAAFHLPDVIDWSATGGSIKRGPHGPYLHIPFRHSAYASAGSRTEQGYTYAAKRAMMPKDVSQAAARLSRTIRLNQGRVYRDTLARDLDVGRRRGPLVERQFVQADRYSWGRRLRRDTTPGIRIGPDGVGYEEHRGARAVGRGAGGRMLENPAWKTSKFEGLFKSGPKGHTSYMTIRTITPHSRGWNIPAMAGKYVARKVAHELTYGETAAELERIVTEPFIAALMGGR